MIFKYIQQEEKKVYNKKDLQSTFSTPILKKDTGWNNNPTSPFNELPSLKTGGYFVDNEFFIGYTQRDGDFEETSLWNTIMSRLQIPYNYDENRFNFFYENNPITKLIVISINPEQIESLSPKNFFLAFADEENDDFLENNNLNFSSAFTTMAPYYIKKSIDDTRSGLENDFKSLNISNAYELRSNTNNEYLTVDQTNNRIIIDWKVQGGSLNPTTGIFLPDQGLILIFPEMFADDDIINTIESAQDKSLASLNTLMYIGGYSEIKSYEYLFFLRMFNSEFNYSNSPTAFKVDGDEFVYREDLEEEPTTFITSVGLYNEMNECLAVVNFNEAFKKDYLTEKLIKAYITDANN